MFDFSVWVESFLPFFQTPFGIIVFIPFYALWVSFLLPGIWISMIAGAIYGTWIGSIVVFIGAFLGAEITFYLGRTLLRTWAQKRMAEFPKFQLAQQAVSREGLKLILLTRLSPAFPFSLLNFVYGLSDVRWRDYTIGLIGVLPGTILFCGLGSLAGDFMRFGAVLSGRTDTHSFVIRVVGLLATLGVVFLVTSAVRRALQESESSESS